VAEWTATVLRLLNERDDDAAAWAARRSRGVSRAAEFSWSRYAAEVVALYRVVASAAGHGAGVAVR
jgi:hypothetical protein